MPFHRAALVKSLVNSQLDSLRSLIFRPQVIIIIDLPLIILLARFAPIAHFQTAGVPVLVIIMRVPVLSGGI